MLRNIRKQYTLSFLDEKSLLPNPVEQFKVWLSAAIASSELEPTAMVLSTSDTKGQSHSRVLLLKELTEKGLVFYTNYEGNKAQQIAQNNKISALFFWPSMERQVRIEGIVHKISENESTDYFKSRPKASQLGAWASPQSKKIDSYEYLESRMRYFQQEFGDTIPRPPHWRGYMIEPTMFEFWQGRASRLHDRFEYKLAHSQWELSRLAP
jgi:pyridoxamine 5'-phosphate oxidase